MKRRKRIGLYASYLVGMVEIGLARPVLLMSSNPASIGSVARRIVAEDARRAGTDPTSSAWSSRKGC